jgi:hypothetical protein
LIFIAVKKNAKKIYASFKLMLKLRYFYCDSAMG